MSETMEAEVPFQGDLKYEEARLHTFRSWPSSAKVEAYKMAQAGFVYTGQADEVRCTFCEHVLSNWQYGDQVMSKHRVASPNCPFVTNQSDNVPSAVSRTSSNHVGLRDKEARRSADCPHDGGPRIVADEDMDEDSADDAAAMEDARDFMTPMRMPLLEGRDSLTPDAVASDVPDISPSEERREEVRNTVQSTHTPPHSSRAMRSEANRLMTYTNWREGQLPRPEDLARAGFYSRNVGDEVKCAFCGNIMGSWEESDIPMEEHRKHFPMCSFLVGLDVGNIPMQQPGSGTNSTETPTSDPAPSSSSSTNVGRGDDVTGIRYQRQANSIPEKGNNFNSEFPENLGVISHRGPLHPSFATIEARLRTFREWPPALKQQPQELADAGFYYIGLSDQVKCFYCDGGLRNWQQEDDPWVEHARWFEKCTFVRLRKGDEFIKSCLDAKPPDTKPEDEMCCEQREVSEDELRQAMNEAVVKQVLSMGIDAARVKMALKRQLEKYGSGFSNLENLVDAAFSVQREQERRAHTEINQRNGAVLETGGFSGYGHDEVTSRWEQSSGSESLYDEDEDHQHYSRSRETASSSASSLGIQTRLEVTAAPQEGPSGGDQQLPGPVGQPSKTSAAEVKPPTRESVIVAPNKNQSESKEEPFDLEKENARLKEQRTCKVCMDGEVGVVFLPCGHLICCVSCAPSLKDCPVCRTPIQGTVRTFLS